MAGTVIRRRVIATSLFAIAAIVLFAVYLRVSRTYPENSDEANILLMSWDMLHGHLMLHGWFMSDVSFYTTELPEYAVLESFLGLHADTAHVGAAITYTIVVLLAVVLARGKLSQVDRGEGMVRMLVAGGIMIAPQLGVGVFVLVLSVGHIGTAVPLLLCWLIIDRGDASPRTPLIDRGDASPRTPLTDRGKRRWPEAVAVGVLFTWALIADPLVLVAGIIPLAGVCLLRVLRTGRGLPRLTGRSARRRALLRACGYELALTVASGAAYGLATCVEGLLHYNGGYRVHSVGYQFVPVSLWPGHAWVTIQGWLAMFGAMPWGSAADVFFAVMHLTGVALVAWAMWLVCVRFGRHPSLVDQVLLVAIVLNVLLYVPSTMASGTDLNAREYALALPYGAVLAARTLGPSIRAALPGRAALAYGVRRARLVRWIPAALAGVMCCYLASLGYTAAQPSAPAANQQLAAWLAAHNLTYGIGGYWQSSIVTLDSEGAVTVRAVHPGNLRRDWWESKHSWYQPGTHTATFLVTENMPGFYNYWEPNSVALAGFGRPSREYTVGPYTIYVWQGNLLRG